MHTLTTISPNLIFTSGFFVVCFVFKSNWLTHSLDLNWESAFLATLSQLDQDPQLKSHRAAAPLAQPSWWPVQPRPGCLRFAL